MLAALALVFCAAAGPEQSAVKVTHQRGQLIDNGSGTVVASGDGVSRVLTNHHVCPDRGTKITVEHGGRSYPATLIAWDAALDLACVEVNAELPACWIANEPPKAGAALYQWGHAGGSPAAVHKSGWAVGVRGRRLHGGAVYETTIRAMEGDSGCGVFDGSGRLVGVCWGRHSDYSGQACVTLADVRAFLRMER